MLLTTALVGCVYRSAMKRGESLAEAGSWRASLEQYDRALSKKPDALEALEAHAVVLPRAIEAALVDGEAALEAFEYEEAVSQLDYVDRLDVDSAPAADLRARVEDAMMADLQALLAVFEMNDAYGMAVRTEALFPQAGILPSAFATLRSHYFERSDQLVAEGAYPDALASLGVVRHYEPRMEAQVSERETQVRAAWAEVVATAGRDKEAIGEIGAAAVLFTRAFEIAGGGRDAGEMRRLASVLRWNGTLTVALSPEDSFRVRPVAEVLVNRLQGLDGVALLPDATSSSSLWIGVRARDYACETEGRVWVAEQPYVSGQRELPNPQHHALADDLDWELGRLPGLEEEAVNTANAAYDADARTSDVQHRFVVPASQALYDADQWARSLEGRIQSTRGLVAQLESDLQALYSREGTEMSAVAAELTLGAERQRLHEEEGALQVAYRDLEAAQVTNDQAVADLSLVQAESNRRSQAARDAASRLGTARDRVADLQWNLSQTSAVLYEDIWDVFYYDVEDLDRTCTASMDLDLHPWGASPYTVTYTQRYWTEDSTHPAYPDYGVAADPLQFPVSDDALIASADGDSAAAMADALAQYVRDDYQARIQRFFDARAQQPDSAATHLIEVYLAAPSRLHDDTVSALREHVLLHYGLEDLGLIGS